MRHQDAIVLYGAVMKIYTKNISPKSTGKAENRESSVLHDITAEAKRKLPIEYWPIGYAP
jgi:hypothetical protein